MSGTNISSGSDWEPVVGDYVHLSGTTATAEDGEPLVEIEADAYIG